MKVKYRQTRYDIYATALRFCREPKPRTQMYHQVNRDYDESHELLSFLFSHGLLKEADNQLTNAKKLKVVATEKGLRFLVLYDQLQKLLS